ncbi:MAG: T9SS type A sorting domain-containing protein [Flavobacteriales bacterium]|nr:T9SS type A sorting domain-containing protein [Flavobacteriales bacterium]
MRKSVSVIAILILTTLSGFGQATWLEVFQNPEADFNAKEAVYKAENGNKKATRGSGMKQYERWRWMAEQRLDEEGKTPGAVTQWKNYRAVQQIKNEKGIGDAWEPVGPINVPFAYYGAGIGRVNVIAFHPTDSLTLWAGSPSGGLWKTVDGGNNWTTNTDMLSNLGISDIVINPHNPDEMYIASGDRNGGDTESYGVLKSTDGGENWNLTDLVFTLPGSVQVTRLIMDTANTQVLYAATSLGIYKTENGGDTWTQKTSTSTRDIEFITGSSTHLLAVAQSTVFKSTDAGETWTGSGTGLPTDNLGRIQLAVSPSNPEYAYVVMGNGQSGFRALCQSVDSGSTWAIMSESPNILGYAADGSEPGGQAWYDLDITIDPNDPLKVWVGGINLWRTNNGGLTWLLAGHWTGDGGMPPIHADQHFLAFHPTTGKLWIGNDGGVWTQNGSLWVIKSAKMSITQYYRFGTAKTAPLRIIAGSQDNGTHFKKTIGWAGVYGGDGMEAMIDHEDPEKIYATIYYGSLFRSDDAGGAFIDVSPGLEGAWVTPFFMDPQDAQSIYSGFDKVMVSYNRGGTWFSASPVLTLSGDEYIRNIAVPRTDGSITYVARRRAIYKGIDYAAEWINITSGLPVSSSIAISYIAVDPFDAQTVYVTLSGYSNGNKVFKTTNGGQNWQNISGNLPNIATFCIETEQSENRGLYVGTEFGVFFKDNTMTEWAPYGTEFPNVQVTELEITEANQMLRACTYGRGVWEIPIQNPLIPNSVSITEQTNSDEMRIYPNPGEGIFTLSANESVFINRILVVSSNGVIVNSIPVNAISSSVTFDVSGLASGVYYARVISDQGIRNYRFVKR